MRQHPACVWHRDAFLSLCWAKHIVVRIPPCFLVRLIHAIPPTPRFGSSGSFQWTATERVA